MRGPVAARPGPSADRRFHLPRAAGRTFVLGLLAALVALAVWPGDPPARAQGGDRPRGRIAVPRGQVLTLVDAVTGADQTVYTAATTQLVLDAALTPNGREAVISRLALARRDDPGGAELYRVPVAGGEPTLVAAYDTPGATLTTPSVAPNGASVYYTYTPYFLGASGVDALPRIERVPLDGGPPTVVMQEAEWPAPAPDGSQLAFIRRTARGDALWLSNLASGEAREVLPPDRFLGLAYPRISPDGTRLAVAATIDFPELPSPLLPRLAPAARPARPSGHGLPWDLWSVALDGSSLTRLTHWFEDDPSLTWSPDGAWLAAQGGSGLRLLEVATGRDERLRREPAFGAIDWARD